MHFEIVILHSYAVATHYTRVQWRWYTVLDWFWFWWNIWNDIVLALDEQLVRWYWRMVEFECVITWGTMHYVTRSQLCTHVLFTYPLYYNDDGTRFRIELYFGWIYMEWLLSCWFWTNRECVGISVMHASMWLNLKVSLFGCNTLLLFKHTTMTINYTRLCDDFDVDLTYGTVSCRLWANRKYVGIGVCLNLKVLYWLLGVRTPSQLLTRLLLIQI